MSNTRRSTVKTTGPAAPELDIPLPGGGRALFYSQAELTPRRTRDLDVMLTRLGPRMQQLAHARQVATAAAAAAVSALPSEILSEPEAAAFNDLNVLAAWVYLKERRDTAGQKLAALESADDVFDLPRPHYKAIVAHAAELVAADMVDQFSVDALPDDLDEADPDLPTSA